ERYAEREGLTIVEWFREVETAAKQGRPIFTAMAKRLRKGEAEGFIVHKVDRSSRNYHDWADINDLADEGFNVCFASDNLDLPAAPRRSHFRLKRNALCVGKVEPGECEENTKRIQETWKLQLAALQTRRDRLVDAFLEGTLEKDAFEPRKKRLLM